MKLSQAITVGIVSALIVVAFLRHANLAGTTELQLASQPAFDRVMKTHTLRCAYSSLAGYFIKMDPEHNITKGLVHDVVEQMGRILKLKIVWAEELSPTQAAENLTAGTEDAMCFPVWPNGTQAASFDYTVPIDYMPIYAYARLDDLRFDGNLAKINDSTVTVPVIGDGIGKIIADEDYPQAAQYHLADDDGSVRLLLAVTTKNADVAFIDPFTGQDFIKNNPGTLRPVQNVAPVRMIGESFAVAKGETKLRDMLNVALDQMQQSGYIHTTLDKYLGDHKGEFFYVANPWQ